jgi:signal peptidase II
MKVKISIKTVFFIILAVFFVFADRFLKALSLKGFFDRPIPLLGNFFFLSYVKNYYIAFSIPFSGPILTGIIGLIILTLLFYWVKFFFSPGPEPSRTKLLYPLSILIIGAILNFTDRIEYGFVIDYLYLKLFTVFNLADCLICGSVIWLVIFSSQKNRSAVSKLNSAS